MDRQFKKLLLIALFLSAGSGMARAQQATGVKASGTDTVAAKADLKQPLEEIISMPLTVNPMTGKTLTYEEKERRLREKTLEVRLADQEVLIAKAAAELRKVQSEGKGRPSAAFKDNLTPSPPVPSPVRAYTAKAASKKVSRKVKDSRSAVTAPASGVQSMQLASSSSFRPRLVGVMDAGNKKVTMWSYGGRVQSVAEGGSFGAGSVSKVTNESASLNGVEYTVDKGMSVIDLPETPRPVAPGSLAAANAAYPTPRGAMPVPGINAQATQPVAVGAPIGGGAASQPVRFPSDLYPR